MHQLLTKDPKKRITTADIQKTAWYNKGHAWQAPKKYLPLQVSIEQMASAVPEAKVSVEINDAPAIPAAPRAPMYV